MTEQQPLDRKDLKIQHYRQRVAEYEERFADMRVEATELNELVTRLQNRVYELEAQVVQEAPATPDAGPEAEVLVEPDSVGDLP